MNLILISFYLIAAIAANLIVAKFGPSVLPITAFFIIPFDLCSRDILHERWKKNKALKMFCLVLTGSILTAIVNKDASKVALASFVAFAISNLIDFLVYQALIKHNRFVKMNLSNLASSITDSIIFPVIAFSVLIPELALKQSMFKFGGGIFWSLIFGGILWLSQKTKNNK